MSPEARFAAGRAGGQASAIVRQAAAAEGRAFAQAYRAASQPCAYTGPYPILSHRTCAEVNAAADERDFAARCSACDLDETDPDARGCQLPQCPLRKVA